MFNSTSSDEGNCDSDKEAQKFDWSSPKIRQKKNCPPKQEVADATGEGMCTYNKIVLLLIIECNILIVGPNYMAVR